MDPAANAANAALADSTVAAAAADAVPADFARVGEAEDTVSAEHETAPAAADAADDISAEGARAHVVPAEVENAADAEPADVIVTGVAVDAADAVMTDITTAGAAAANTADAVFAEKARAAAAAAADTPTVEVAAAGGVAGKVNLQSQVADQAAGDTGEAVQHAETQMVNAYSHVPGCKLVSMADELQKSSLAAFLAAAAFSGAKGGMVFKTGDQGLGYYADTGGMASALSMAEPLERASPTAAVSRCSAMNLAAKEPDEYCNYADVDSRPALLSAMVSPSSTAACMDDVSAGLCRQARFVKEVLHKGKAMHTGQKEGEDLQGGSEGMYEAGVNWQVKGEGVDGKADEGDNTGHYWGQALQYLDRSVQVCHPLIKQIKTEHSVP